MIEVLAKKSFWCKCQNLKYYSKSSYKEIVSIMLKSNSPDYLSQDVRMSLLAGYFEFRACLAGRCLCSQNIVNKYLNKSAKWLSFISRLHIRTEHISLNSIHHLIKIHNNLRYILAHVREN